MEGYRPEFLDWKKSPYTGLTRKSWIHGGQFLLSGIFQNLESMDAPMIMPRREWEITYPHLKASKEVQAGERKAEIFEGLTRSFFIGSVLIHEEPDLILNGICVREYYRLHILRSCTRRDHEEYVGTYEDMQEAAGWADPFRPFQQTVETCALVIGLWACQEEIWMTYSQEEKDAIADFLLSFANAPTAPQNWRFFNMLVLAFLHMEGYSIRRELMLEHGQALLGYYGGDGWYRDGHSFDYYSCWAFQMYGPIWNVWYGYENAPWLAARFEEYSNKLMESYPNMFDRDGWTNMWGRSGIYRNAATSALEVNLLLHHSAIRPGLARRICSGSLLQFMTRDDVLHEGVPALGFYGPFLPLVQAYSCAESPLWMGKAFLCLHFPENHPFWTEVETNGVWEGLEEGKVEETLLDGPALCVTNHGGSGETILRTGKVNKMPEDIHGMWNYSKLCYNSKYPWEAGNEDGSLPHTVESQQYVIENILEKKQERANVTLWAGRRKGILYRRQFFGYDQRRECHWLQAVDLADFPVAEGIVRVDKLRLCKRPAVITLGSYGFPDNGTHISFLEKKGARAIILKGKDHMGRDRQMAMTAYDGWQELTYRRSQGTNPDSDQSILVYGSARQNNQYDASQAYVFISQVITRDSHTPFREEEIFPIRSIHYEDAFKTGAYGPIRLEMENGDIRTVCFEEMEGRLGL